MALDCKDLNPRRRSVKNHIRTFEIPRRDWRGVLDRFTEKHSGLPVELETHDRETEEQQNEESLK